MTVLDTCPGCGTTILFGGVRREAGVSYCSEKCANADWLTEVIARESPKITPQEAQARAMKLRNQICPACSGAGPLDIYRSHRIWSLVKVACATSHEHYCCQSCGKRRQKRDWLISLCCGWWSLTGLFLTPGTLSRGWKDWRLEDDPLRPSERLLAFARLGLAKELVASAARTGAKPAGVPGALDCPPGPARGWAIASLVCGAAGIVICIGGSVLGLAAILCGRASLRHCQETKADGGVRGLARAGIAFGVLAMLIGIAVATSMIWSGMRENAWKAEQARRRQAVQAPEEPRQQPPTP